MQQDFSTKMEAHPSTSRDSSTTLPGSISSIEINDDNSSAYMYDSLGRLIVDNGNGDRRSKETYRRSWSGYQTLPANFKQHHCHVSRKKPSSVTRRQHLLERPCRSLSSSPVRVWGGCLGRSQNGMSSKNNTEYTNGTMDSSQESISSNTQSGPLGGCCGGGHRRTFSESNPPEEGMKRSQTSCTPLASLRARLRRTMSEGEPNGIMSGRNSPIRLVPNPHGSLVESPRRLVKLRIKCDHASYPHQAVFRKILSATKNKLGKGADIKYKAEGGAGTSQEPTSEEFERRKQEWQDELEEMSEFLLIKSFNEQAEESVDKPVDTAFIEDRQGTPYLKALFDVKHFKAEDVDVNVEDGTLVVTAQGVEDKDDRVYRKTLVRQIELPEQVNIDLMHTDITKDGLLSIEMPFKLPERRKPPGPNVFPIVEDPDGRKKIQLDIYIGTEFTDDDVKVESNGTHLYINAGYDAEIGKYGQQVRQREFKREYILPEHLHVDHVQNKLENGKLSIEIYLKDEKPYRCTITAEDLS